MTSQPTKKCGLTSGPVGREQGRGGRGGTSFRVISREAEQGDRKHTTSSDSDAKVLSPSSLTGGSGAFFLPSLNLCGLSCGADSKESTCNVGDPGCNPWVRKIPWRRAWQPTPVSLPEGFHGQRSLAGYRPWGRCLLVKWRCSGLL